VPVPEDEGTVFLLICREFSLTSAAQLPRRLDSTARVVSEMQSCIAVKLVII